MKKYDIVSHPKYGNRLEVIGFLPNSRTIVQVKDIDKGPGWDESTHTHKGVRQRIAGSGVGTTALGLFIMLTSIR